MKNLFYFEEYGRKGAPSKVTGTSNWVRKGCFTFLIVSIYIFNFIYIYIKFFLFLLNSSLEVSTLHGHSSMTVSLVFLGLRDTFPHCPVGFSWLHKLYSSVSIWVKRAPALPTSFILMLCFGHLDCAWSMVCEFEMSGERTEQCISLKI